TGPCGGPMLTLGAAALMGVGSPRSQNADSSCRPLGPPPLRRYVAPGAHHPHHQRSDVLRPRGIGGLPQGGTDVVDEAKAGPAVLPSHLTNDLYMEEPFMRCEPTGAEGVVKVLAGPGAVAVESDRKAVDAQFRHGCTALGEVSCTFVQPE